MSECQQFPDTWEEFEQLYGFTDREEVYTNGSRLIQSFRVKQWLDHIAKPERTAKVKNIAHIRGYPPEGECSNCGYDVVDDGKYCPGCGCKLEWK